MIVARWIAVPEIVPFTVAVVGGRTLVTLGGQTLFPIVLKEGQTLVLRFEDGHYDLTIEEALAV